MTWRFVMGLFTGVYEFMLGIFGIYGLRNPHTQHIFGLNCG
jgi:hypothetical protein